MKLRGSLVALVTPFTAGGRRVDLPALRRLVEFHVRHGSAGLVPCGTTGESATLTHEEHRTVIRETVRSARGRIPVIAGTGSNNTAEAVAMTRAAERDGADATLQITPYYNKPTQRGLEAHFLAVARATRLPVILYNIPGRTGVNMEPDTVARLAEVRNIVGIKEASGNLEQMARIVARCGERFTLLSGDDALTLPILSLGGEGVISVVANLAPGEVSDLIGAFQRGDIARARTVHERLLPLTRALFVETNPVPVKAALGLMRLCRPDLRLPLVPLLPASLAALKAALRRHGLVR